MFVCAKRVLSAFHLFVSDSEMRAMSAEQRALKAEEALQSALVKIQDLERNPQARSSPSAEGTANTNLELRPRHSDRGLNARVLFYVAEQTETPPPSAPMPTPSTPTKKVTAETKAMSGTKKTKKR